MTAGGPVVSVIISTRDRGDSISRTMRSVLANEGAEFEIIVVDQSGDDRTETAIGPFLGDPRIRYLKSPGTGLARGRNTGIEAAAGTLIAITDDDCTVDSKWVRRLVEAFEVDPAVGIVFGNVEPAPHDSSEGFVTGYVRKSAALTRSIEGKLDVEGIGACMGVRTKVWAELRGFDESLGIGARFPAGEETDFSMRLLEAGYSVYETPEFTVTHHGFCPAKDARAVVERNWFGTGAVYGKNVRRRPGKFLPLLARLGGRFLFSGRSRVAQSLHAPYRLARFSAFVQGFGAGFRTEIDPDTGHFLTPDTPD